MDRNLYKSDKKLANRGWHAMRRALDREMPEERRRRPVALLWIFALLAPVAGLLGWYLIGQGHVPAGRMPVAADSRQPALQTPERQIADNTEPASPAGQTGPEGKNRKAEQSKSKPAGKQKNTAKTKMVKDASGGGGREKMRSEGRTIMALQSTPAAEPAASLLPPAQSVAVQEIPLPSSPVLAVQNQTPDVAAAEPVPIAESPAGSEQQTPPAASSIAASSLTDNAANAPFFLPPKPIDPLRENPKAWAFAASAGVFSNTKGDYTGTGAGLNAEWQPLKHWGLRSGVGYQYRQLGTEERPVVAVATSNYVDATGDLRVAAANGNFNQTPTTQGDNAPVFVPISRLHRLEVPILAFWQPMSKLRLFGGVSVGSNLYAQTGDRSLSNNVVYDISGNAAKNLNQEVSSQVREWDSRLSVGVGFKPLRQMEIGLFLHQPIGGNKLWNNQAEKLNSNGQYNPGNVQDFTGNSTQNQSKINAGALLNLTASWFF